RPLLVRPLSRAHSHRGGPAVSGACRQRARLDRLEHGKRSTPGPTEGMDPGSRQGLDARHRPVDQDRAPPIHELQPPSCHKMPGISVSTKGSMATARNSSDRYVIDPWKTFMARREVPSLPFLARETRE